MSSSIPGTGVTDAACRNPPGLNAPGVYLLGGADVSPSAHQGLRAEGPFLVGASGRLASEARAGGWLVVMEGLLTSPQDTEKTDAENLLAAFRENGPACGAYLDGFFTALVLNPERDVACLIYDVLSARPSFLYRRGRAVAVAPTPLFFRENGLPMEIDRRGLYETIRLGHSCSDRTLIAEVTRATPASSAEIRADGGVAVRRSHTFAHREDSSVDLRRAAEMVSEVTSHTMDAVLGDPRLRDLPIEMQLTAGLDSRHILGELLQRDRPPQRFRHINIVQAELDVVRVIGERYSIPVDDPGLADLDFRSLTSRWLQRSGGLTNFHEFYQLHVCEGLPDSDILAFHGYLMDWFLGIYAKRPVPRSGDPLARIWNRTYKSRGFLPVLFRDSGELAAAAHSDLRHQAERIDGPAWFKMIVLDMHHRGVKYTGAAFPMMADEVQCFAPGAHRRSLAFIETVPCSVGGEKRARLEAFRMFFPELARIPNAKGHSYTGMTTLRKSPAPVMKTVRNAVRGFASFGKVDVDPESEHCWLRRVPPLVDAHRRLAKSCLLARDGHIRELPVRAMWEMNWRGGPFGWVLMTLMTAEVAYRTLVLGQSPEDVVDWMFPARGERDRES